jgi:hypothetical protein
MGSDKLFRSTRVLESSKGWTNRSYFLDCVLTRSLTLLLIAR